MSHYRGAGKVRSASSKADGLLRMLSDAVGLKVQPWGKQKFAEQACIIPSSALQRLKKLEVDGMICEHHKVGNAIFYVVTPLGVEYLRDAISLLSDIDLENCDPEEIGRAFLKLTPPLVEAREQLKLLEEARESGKRNGHPKGEGSDDNQDGPKDTREEPDKDQLAALRLVRVSGGYGGFEYLCRIGRSNPDIDRDTLMSHLEWLEKKDWIKVQYKPIEDDPKTWYWAVIPFDPNRTASKENDGSKDKS